VVRPIDCWISITLDPCAQPLGRFDLDRQAVAVVGRLVLRSVLGGGAGCQYQRGQRQPCCLKDARHVVSPTITRSQQ
jgi:hypothetical protein